MSLSGYLNRSPRLLVITGTSHIAHYTSHVGNTSRRTSLLWAKQVGTDRRTERGGAGRGGGSRRGGAGWSLSGAGRGGPGRGGAGRGGAARDGAGRGMMVRGGAGRGGARQGGAGRGGAGRGGAGRGGAGRGGARLDGTGRGCQGWVGRVATRRTRPDTQYKIYSNTGKLFQLINHRCTYYTYIGLSDSISAHLRLHWPMK